MEAGTVTVRSSPGPRERGKLRRKGEASEVVAEGVEGTSIRAITLGAKVVRGEGAAAAGAAHPLRDALCSRMEGVAHRLMCLDWRLLLLVVSA
jgi:hypothetical protein